MAWQAGGASITEAAIAREMQHHRADDPQRARDEATRALGPVDKTAATALWKELADKDAEPRVREAAASLLKAP